MRQKKIRGHKRRWKKIEHWRLANLSFDLADYLLNVRDRYHTKINVHPWNGISITHSANPEPAGKTKQKMFTALLDIYEHWKKQLDQLGQPYYLKIWLFDPRFSQSQVVCAMGTHIDFYENTFYKPDNAKTIQLDAYGVLKTKLAALNWDYSLDEDYSENKMLHESEIYASREDGEDIQKELAKRLKKPHRTYQFKEPNGETSVYHAFKRGDVWIGEIHVANT